MKLTSEMIKQKAKELGIDDIGIGGIDRYADARSADGSEKLLPRLQVGDRNDHAHTAQLIPLWDRRRNTGTTTPFIHITDSTPSYAPD